jgi:hypothetical protein
LGRGNENFIASSQWGIDVAEQTGVVEKMNSVFVVLWDWAGHVTGLRLGSSDYTVWDFCGLHDAQ